MLLLVTTSADQSARVWKTADFSLVQELKVDNGQRWVWDVAFSADSQYIITASSDNIARLWSVETGTVQREYTGHQKAVTALAFSDQVNSTESSS
ncbi:Target of rapamycin complex subunit lst8 [Homalodisca vitripennis]|nr:Target of rapamycin complex subunit lst8 [Homalodisca vitripennis]KAG8298857.1 Target of rapamycin complex subunit lst8 [Homalodisca vitripennis]